MKKDNNLLLIGAVIILYFLLKKKAAANMKNAPSSGSSSGSGMFNNVTPKQRARIKADVNKAVKTLNIEPIADEMEDFKNQYYNDIKECKI